MNEVPNRYLLVTETNCNDMEQDGGHWQFVLRSTDNQFQLHACDFEPGVTGERLSLLTLVRGLEAIETESKITLVTDSRYVIRGLRYGLSEWRENGWRWNQFGEWTSINHADLWKRLDHALGFHQLQCRHFRIDPGQPMNGKTLKGPHFARRRKGKVAVRNSEESTVFRPSNSPLDETWISPAQSLARKLDTRWDQQLVEA